MTVLYHWRQVFRPRFAVLEEPGWIQSPLTWGDNGRRRTFELCLDRLPVQQQGVAIQECQKVRAGDGYGSVFYIYIYGTTDWLGKKLSIVTNYSVHQLRLKIEAPFFWDRLEWLECICISRKSICSVGKRPMTWPKKNPDGWTSGYLKGALGTSLMDTMTPMTITHRIHGAGIYGNIWGILMVNVTIYGIHGSYGLWLWDNPGLVKWWLWKLQPELHGDLTQKHGWYFQWSSDFGRRVAEAPVRLLLEPMCLVVSSMEYTHVVIFTAYAFFWKDRTSWKHGKQQISAAGNVLIYIYIYI